MFLLMVDEDGRAVAHGSDGEQFMKSLSGVAPARKLTPMRPMNIESGFAPIPLVKSFSSKAEQIDAVIAEAQRKYGRFQTLRRLEELGLV